MTVNGGSLTITGPLTVYNTAGSSLTLSSGSITAASLTLTAGNANLFTWTGGSLSLTNGDIEIDNSANANMPSGQIIGPTQSLSVRRRQFNRHSRRVHRRYKLGQHEPDGWH